MDNRSWKFLWLLIIIDYQYQSIIDGNWSINIIIPHGRSRPPGEDRGGRGRLHRHITERRRKRNNKLNRVWATTASQVSWIFAMNSKLNWSSLYYWQRDMLIVLIICAVFHGATSMNYSQTLLLRFKNNIRSAYTPAIPEDTETWI